MFKVNHMDQLYMMAQLVSIYHNMKFNQANPQIINIHFDLFSHRYHIIVSYIELSPLVFVIDNTRNYKLLSCYRLLNDQFERRLGCI